MAQYNNNDYFDDDNDDFDVDFNDSLGYEESSSKTKRTKRASKDTKKSPKKEIKVDTKKPKKKVVKKSTSTKKTTSSKTVKKSETKKPVKEEKVIKVVKRTSKDRTTTKRVAKKEETLNVNVEEIIDQKKEEALKSEITKKEEKPVIEEKKDELLKQETKEEKEKTRKKIESDDLEDVEIELEEVEEETEELPIKKEEKEVEKVVEPEKPVEHHEEKHKSEDDIYNISIFKVLKYKLKKIFGNLKNYKKQLIISAVVLFVLLAGFFAVKTGFISFSSDSSEDNPVILQDIDILEEYHNTWNSYEDLNSDYVGQIIFDSQLINKPFVQATSCYKENGVPYKFYNQDGSIVADFSDKTGNDVYIWMDFETMQYDYDKKGGSIFMDYRNVLSDQNLIIYGHYFSTIYNKDPDRVKSFTPLEKLLEKNNYKDNSRVYLVLEDEIRTYDLYAVYKFDSENDEYWEKGQYYRPNYNVDDFTGEEDSNYMLNYIKFVDSVKLYKTDVSLEPGDKTLTLQTCMTPSTTLYEICVFKEVDVSKY